MLDVHSPAFDDGESLPIRFASASAGGSDTSPPLSWTGVPPGTRSLAITCVDHHPVAHEYLHWVVVELPPDVPFLAEGASRSKMMPAQARELAGTSGAVGYHGAGPPPRSGPHPYEFTVWALDTAGLDMANDVGLAGFQAAISGHVLASGSITGIYER
jgi:Raf kinase inhibitor-like YbhB/YbcL family protein